MSDELVDEVRAALDPTPASEADWPVSRRRVLQGLASVGALSLGPGAASGAAGTASADQAFFSNYGATSTADGWDVTIDGDVFSFDGDDTIGLPDGGTGTELLTPSGASASEVIGPGGSVVFDGVVIPDSVVALWNIGEGSGTTSVDDEGDEDLTLNGPTWQSNADAREGNYLAFDGTDDDATAPNNNNTFTDVGDFTVFGVIRAADGQDSAEAATIGSYDTDNNNRSWWAAVNTDFDELRLTTSADGANFERVDISAGESLSGSWISYAFTREASSGAITAYLNASEVGSDTTSITGSLYANNEPLRFGRLEHTSDYNEGDYDLHAFADSVLTQSEIQQLHDLVPRFQ